MENTHDPRLPVLALVVVSLLVILSLLSVPIFGDNHSSVLPNDQKNQTPAGASPKAFSVLADNWLTYHKYNNRTGYDTSLPNIDSPGVSWKTSVDGMVYAEPLYYNGNVYVATENDSVYSLNVATGTVQWRENVGIAASSTKPPLACPPNGPSIVPQVGITGTPVLDPASGTIYVVAMVNGSGYWMFALNVNTGQVRWKTIIHPAGFDYLAQEQRGALALADGLVYAPFGGFDWICGSASPVGWVFGLPVNNNGTLYSYKVPSNPEGDIWTPEGVSVDSSGFVYAVTGDSNNATFDYGDTVIKLSPDLKTVVDYFAPSNWQYLNLNDIDLGSTGATLLPGNLIFSMGKNAVGYLLNASKLGGIGGQLYSLPLCAGGSSPGAWGSTSYANGVIYVPCGDGNGLIALKLNPGSHPSFGLLWNYSRFIFAGPPIIAAGAVWTFDIYSGTLYALNPLSGSLMFRLPPLISPGALPHFTTPTEGGGMLLIPEGSTIIGLNPACDCTTTSSTTSSTSNSTSSTSGSSSSTTSSSSGSSSFNTSNQTSSSSSYQISTSTPSSSSIQSTSSSQSPTSSVPPAPPPNSNNNTSLLWILAIIIAIILIAAATLGLQMRKARSQG